MSQVPRLPLARLPTPLERLDRISEELGAEIWVKRDDLTGTALSGNEIRKLEHLVADAEAQGADTLITCGAVTSNHCRATAIAAARRDLACELVLRGREPDVPAGNLLLDRLVGAGTRFIDRRAWRDRTRLLEEVAEEVRARGGRPYVIPEGGSNAIGSLGYVRAADELWQQARDLGLDLRRVVHATGSGGTTAGLAAGFAAPARAGVEVVGIAVCYDLAWFDRTIGGIVADLQERGAFAGRARWRVLDAYRGEGYAQTTPEELAFLAHVARTEGLILDPVYTNKAFRGMVEETRAGRLGREGVTVFVHTGGIFGLFGFGRELRDLPAQSSPSGPR